MLPVPKRVKQPESCAICIEGDATCDETCSNGHSYHGTCLTAWRPSRRTITCPTCRVEMARPAHVVAAMPRIVVDDIEPFYDGFWENIENLTFGDIPSNVLESLARTMRDVLCAYARGEMHIVVSVDAEVHNFLLAIRTNGRRKLVEEGLMPEGADWMPTEKELKRVLEFGEFFQRVGKTPTNYTKGVYVTCTIVTCIETAFRAASKRVWNEDGDVGALVGVPDADVVVTNTVGEASSMLAEGKCVVFVSVV